MPDNLPLPFDDALPDVTTLADCARQLINAARQRAAAAVNRELTLMYWHIGDTIRCDILRAERAAYGKQILATLSQQLREEFGSGYTESNLSRMMTLAEVFPDIQIVATLSAQLGWSHFKEIMPIKERLKREFTPRCAGWKSGAFAHCGPR